MALALVRALAPANTSASDEAFVRGEHAPPQMRSGDASRATRWTGFAAVVGVHVLALTLLWHPAPRRVPLVSSAPIFVELLSPPKPLEPEPEPPKPVVRPRPTIAPTHAPRPAPVEPIIAAPLAMTPPSESTAPAPEPPVEVVAPKAETASAPVTPPRFDADYLRNPSPPYPPMSRRNGEQGRVLLRVLVGPDGDAREVVIKTSSGAERLDRAAQDTVRLWKFVPARVGSDTVAAWVLVPIVFTLER